ncbi:Zinc/iron permease [Blastocladiella britannica]|nr:Zinc/iron permease [Blastocladiella britannica]
MAGSFGRLLALSMCMFAASFLAGHLPLSVSLSEHKMHLTSVFGAGLIVGTALVVILPEGVETLVAAAAAMPRASPPPKHSSDRHDHDGHQDDHDDDAPFSLHRVIGTSLLVGFTAMFLIEQAQAFTAHMPHAHGHHHDAPPPAASSSAGGSRNRGEYSMVTTSPPRGGNGGADSDADAPPGSDWGTGPPAARFRGAAATHYSDDSRGLLQLLQDPSRSGLMSPDVSTLTPTSAIGSGSPAKLALLGGSGADNGGASLPPLPPVQARLSASDLTRPSSLLGLNAIGSTPPPPLSSTHVSSSSASGMGGGAIAATTTVSGTSYGGATLRYDSNDVDADTNNVDDEYLDQARLTASSPNRGPALASAAGQSVVAATIGMVIHAFSDGVAMGAASAASSPALETVVFLAILLHKGPSAFGLTTFLMHHGTVSRRRIRAHLLAFSIAAPLAACTTYLALQAAGGSSSSGADKTPSAADVANVQRWTGTLLLFSAGSFLYVATVHVLPEVLARRGRLTGLQVAVMVIGMLSPLLLQVEHTH